MTKLELWNAIVSMMPLSAYDYINRKMNKAELQEVYDRIKPMYQNIANQVDAINKIEGEGRTRSKTNK